MVMVYGCAGGQSLLFRDQAAFHLSFVRAFPASIICALAVHTDLQLDLAGSQVPADVSMAVVAVEAMRLFGIKQS